MKALSYDLINPQKSYLQNTITLGVRNLICEFWEDTNMQTKAMTVVMMIVEPIIYCRILQLWKHFFFFFFC